MATSARKVYVKKIGVGSLAKLVGVLHAVIGAVIGLVTTVAVAANLLTSNTQFIQSLGISLTVLGLGVIVYPLVLFVFGWVYGAVAALVLNFVLRETNGLNLDVEEER